MAVNQITTATGKVRAVCEHCGGYSRAVTPRSGQVRLDQLAIGWSVVPYPLGHMHSDGSTGSRYCCPKCGSGRRS